jgi:hypothetical protein
MKRRCMGSWRPHLPTAADMGHGIMLWATSFPKWRIDQRFPTKTIELGINGGW